MTAEWLAGRRVAVWTPWGNAVPGGMPNLAKSVARGLVSIGVDAELVETDEFDPRPYALVHGFGLSTVQMRRVRDAGVPIVITPLYWTAEYNHNLFKKGPFPRSFKHRAREAAGFAKSAFTDQPVRAAAKFLEYEIYQRMTYESADLLLPNSPGEGEAMARDVKTTTKWIPVNCGVDPGVFTPSPLPWEQRTKVVSIARFEPHKNQLGLVRALRDLPYEVAFIGHQHPAHPEYIDKCKAEAPAHHSFHIGVSRAELVELLHQSRVHILGSFFETTGLVSLEAALTGAHAVSTDRGYTRSCLNDWATYCDPGDDESIRRAVTAAYNAPPNPKVIEEISRECSFESAALATVEAYRTGIPRFANQERDAHAEHAAE